MEEEILMKGSARKRLQKKIIAIIIVVFSIALFLLYFTWEPFRSFVDTKIIKKEVNESDAVSINIPSVSSKDVFSVGQKTYILQNGNIKLYNQLTKEVGSLSLTVGEPLYDYDDNYMVIADKNSTNVYLLDDGKVVWEKKTDMPIIHVSVNKDGKVVIITKHSIYKALAIVVNKKGKDEVRTYISEGFVIDSDISKNGKYLAIGVVDYSKTTANSNIKIVSLEAKNQKENVSEELSQYNKNDLLIDVSIKDTGDLVARYSKSIDRYSLKNKSEEEIYKINEKTEFADIVNGTVNMVIEKENQNVFQNKYILKILNNYGKQIFSSTIGDISVRSIKAKGNSIAIDIGKEIIVYSNNGFIKKKYKSKIEPIDYKINDSQLIVIFNDKIDIIPI